MASNGSCMARVCATLRARSFLFCSAGGEWHSTTQNSIGVDAALSPHPNPLPLGEGDKSFSFSQKEREENSPVTIPTSRNTDLISFRMDRL